MEEALIALLVLGLAAAMLVVPIFTFIAFARTSRLSAEVEALKKRLRSLEGRGAPTVSEPSPAPVAPAPPAAPVPVEPARVAAPPPPEPTVVVAPPPEPERSAETAPPADLATNLGPKILVGFGALAVFASLAFFVKYAWDNDWVGPTGRVLFGLVVSLGLVAFGLRLMGRVYRPLGQGLAGTGFAGLYVSTFAAHGFYNLIPREVAGVFLLGVTACAILIALRLDARLLAALAWVGAYLTPVLLSTGRDQALSLFAYLLLLGAGAVAIRRRKAWPETAPLALFGTLVLYVGWCAEFYKPERFPVAAVGLVALAALFTEVLPVVTTLLAGLGAVALVVDVDQPVAITGLLCALAGLAMLRRARFAFSETVTVLASWIAIAVWLGQFYKAERLGDALLLAVSVAGLYFLSLAVRGLLLGEGIGGAGLATHVLGASLLWSVLYRAFYTTHPALLGGLSVALAAVYLMLGLGLSRREGGDAGHLRVALGLAATFVTLAIPVQLGLHGITLAWTFEGVLLLALGLRFQSPLTRLAGYGVLGLAVLRLFARHVPLHPEAFAPFVNPAFATWLCVIVALAVAARLLRGAPLANAEGLMRVVLGGTALVFLFGLLTAETHAMFDQKATAAAVDGLDDVAQRARLTGGLAISVLWSAFAVSLLAAGLVVRSRALFWSSYALFALAGFKVVFIDLAELHTLYRILSFLALGVLLMLGAYVNIRFSDRLKPRAES